MTNHEWRAYCLENGLCVSCHKPSDTGKQYCSACAEKNRKQNAEQREFYIANGICPVCRTNNLVGEEKTCAECRAKRAERDKNRNKSEWSIQKAEQRRRRISNGLCIVCGKPLNEEKHSTCASCREKRRDKYNILYGKDRSNRSVRGQCYICGSRDLVDGQKLCILCYKRTVKNTKKMNEARKKDKGE